MARLHPADIRAIAVAVADEIERRQRGERTEDEVGQIAADMAANVRAARARMVRAVVPELDARIDASFARLRKRAATGQKPAPRRKR